MDIWYIDIGIKSAERVSDGDWQSQIETGTSDEKITKMVIGSLKHKMINRWYITNI